MNTTSDAAIIAASHNRPAAFEEIVLRHHSAIARYVYRRMGRQLGEDVVSDVFTTAFARRATYDPAYADAAPWLFGIATNLVRRNVRKEVAMLRRYATSTVDPVAPDVGYGAHGFDPALAAVLGAMRKEHRDVLFLHAVADLSLEQIAVALDVPLGTVKAWLSRARDFAAAELGRHQDTTLVGKERSANGHS